MAQQRKKRNIPLRRRLSDLFEEGREVRFNENGVVNAEPVEDGEVSEAPGEGDEPQVYPTEDDLVVWVAPPNPLQREMALREASASRARSVLAARKDKDSYDSIAARATVAEAEDDELIDLLIDIDEAERRQEAERNLLGQKEWEDFTELQDAMRQWAESDDPDDDKWNPLLERDLEFGRQVNDEFNRVTEASRESLKILPRSELEERAVKKTIDMAGNAEFMNEYQRWMFFYACRDGDDHDKLAFDAPDDLSSLPDFVSEALANVYRDFIDTERSAKNSPRAAVGSEPSALPVEPETFESSTPEEPTDSATSPGSSKSQSSTP